MSEAIRGVLIDNFGRPISAASVTVKKAGTGTDASLYSDETLLSATGNPMTTEVDGSYLAYAANGKYDLTFAKAGVTFDSTDSVNETLFDPQIVKTVSAAYNLSENDYVILADASVASFVINLPAFASILNGRSWIIIKVDASANTVTLDPSGTETIKGASTLVMSGAQAVQILKTTSDWKTATPATSGTASPGAIPLGRAGDGKLAASWGGGASSLATLTAASLVVENPASATATPTINSIPIADQAGGRLAWGWKPAWRGATVRSTNSQSVPNNIVTDAVLWAEEIRDTDSIHVTQTKTCTISIASPAIVSITAHGWSIGDSINFGTSGALPTGLAVNKAYYIISAGFTADQFEVSETRAGAAINTSGTQSGVHSAEAKSSRLVVPSGITRVRLSAKMSWAGSSVGLRQIGIYKNNAPPSDTEANLVVPVNANMLNGTGVVTTPILDVTTGDFFSVVLLQDSGGALNFLSGAFTWFEMELIQ